MTLLQALRKKRTPVTALTLANEFEVSERTIYRDIQTLIAQGAMISGEGGVGYILRDDFFLPPLAFDREEASAIMLGLRFVLCRGDPLQIAAAESARGKLTAAAPERFTATDEISSPLLVGPLNSVRIQALTAVRDCLKTECKLAIEYIDADGSRSRRTTWPVAIGWFDHCEMLAAWCESRSAFRHFRVDRLIAVQKIDERPPISRSRLIARYKEVEQGIAL